VDIEETARFLAVSVWLSNMDSILALGQNYYLYLDHKSEKFQFIPWDMDHSFGQFPMVGTEDQRMNLSLDKPWRGQNRFLERMFNYPAFKTKYLAVFKEYNDTLFKPERMARQVDELAAILRNSVKEESSEKLTRFDKVISGETVTPTGFGGPMGQGTKPIKPFAKARHDSIISQLSGKNHGETLDTLPGGPGGGPDMGPGTFLAPVFIKEMDANKDSKLTREEFVGGFKSWFAEWTKSEPKPALLSPENLRTGIDKKFAFPQGGPGGPGNRGG
jgi:spore coat protein H